MENNQLSDSCYIQIAKKLICINRFNPCILDDFRAYLSPAGNPDLTIDLSKTGFEIGINQIFYDKIPFLGTFGNNVAIMYNYKHFESLLICKKVSDYLLESGIILMHGAAISVDNKCFVFIAPSGTGKTTHILNWLKMVPGSIIVNGDKPFIDVINKIVYGSPWSGKERLNNNISVPLSGIVVLMRSSMNSINAISFQEILPSLLSQVYIPSEQPLLSLAYSHIGRFKNVPFYKMLCNTDKESALVAYETLVHKYKI